MNRLVKIIPLLVITFISSCNSDNNSVKERELDIRQKELELKEKELQLQAQSNKTASLKTQSLKQNKTKAHKELRYLYFANGGIIGYFDDGTYAGCPKCDFCRSNILPMFNAIPDGTYVVKNDGSLLLSGGNVETPTIDRSNYDGWALINYKWYIKPPQN